MAPQIVRDLTQTGAALRGPGFLYLVSEIITMNTEDPFGFPDLPIPPLEPPVPSYDDYQRLLIESCERADALQNLRATIAEWQAKYVRAECGWREQWQRASTQAIEQSDAAHKYKGMLVVTARGVCPILREYLLFASALPASTQTPTFHGNVQVAKELLLHLATYEKM